MVTLPRWRRVVALATASATLLTSIAFWAVPSAEADTAPSAGTPATASTTSLPAPQVNGVVWAQTVIGNTVYAGGNFTQAQPAGAAAGVDTVSRSALLAYDLTTGVLVASFAPSFNGQIRGLAASADGTTLYAVGDFTTVSGTSHAHVVALDATTGAVKSAFTATANSSTFAVTVSGTTVYIGGSFTSVDNVTRTRAAAVDGISGALTGWAPQIPDYTVRALVVSPDQSQVVLGGSFTSVNGSTSPGQGLASVDATTGTTNMPWAVGNLIYDHGSNSAIFSLYSDGTNVYGTGYVFGKLSDGNLEGTFNASWNGGTINWIEDCHGDSYSVATMGDVVYTVSHAHFCGDVPNGFYQTDPNSSKAAHQRALAFTKAATGTIAHDPYGAPYADLYGQPAPSLLTWYPDLAMGSFTGQYQAAWSVTTAKGYVLLGGEFPTVNGQRQVGLARFATTAITPDKDGPVLSATNFSSGTNWKASALSLSAGTVRVRWPSNWDRDNANLTYTVKRGSTVVYTTTARSEGYWLRPTMGFTDTGLTPGTTQTYTVTATDPSGNSATSAASTVTVSSGPTASLYSNDVVKDGATDYWRLGEASGPTVYDWAGDDDLVAGTGVTFGTAGAITADTNTAATFSGATDASGIAASQHQIAGPDTFTIESWFRTSSTAGGKIVGFGDKNTGSSSTYDRHVYMDGSGTVYFGVHPGTSVTVRSAPGFNDGKWHYVVASLSSAGMQLFLDGVKVAGRTDVTTAQPYPGYWRIGGDSSWAGAGYFAGDIDDTAIYPTALSAATVQAHFADAQSGRPAPTNAPPVARFTATPTNLQVTFDASASQDPDGSVTSYSWSFGDGSTAVTGTAPTTSHTYAAAGTYPVSLTVTDDQGATNTVTEQVTVVAPNQPPTAAFTSSVSGMGASLDASASADKDGTISSYAWDFGDGATQTVTTATTAHTYTAAGTYTVALTVTDNSGASTTVSHSVTVSAPNQAPTASFTSSASGLAVSVDGSGSSDPDGTIRSYAWDFGDGATGTGATAGHTYAAGGSYTVKLTVTDDGGATAATTHGVTVTAPASTTLASDAFNRTTAGGLGSADVGGPWTVTGVTSDYSVAPGAAHISTAPGATKSAYLGSVSTASSDVSTTISLPNLSVGGRSFAGVVGRRVGTDDYNARILVDPNGAVAIEVVRDGTALKSATVPGLTYTPGLALRLRMQTTGTSPTTVQARVWKSSDAEPTGWQVTATDSTAALQAAGSVGLRSYLGATVTSGSTTYSFGPFSAATVGAPAQPQNAAPTASFTATTNGAAVSVDGSGSSDSDGSIASYAWDFGDGSTGTGATATHTYTASGTFVVTLTVTDDGGAKDTATKQVTVTVPTPPSTTHLAADAFGRTVTGGLGTADTGGAWTVTNGPSNYSVGNGAATISTAKGQTQSAYLGSVSATSSDVSVGLTVPALPAGGSLYAGVVGRRVGSSDYNARVIVYSTGSLVVQLQRDGTLLKSATVSGLTVAAGSRIDLRLQTVGTGTTTLQARAWLDGATEPTGWQVSATDTTAALQAAGSVGLRTYVSAAVTNGPIAIGFDDFLADAVN